MAEGPGTKAGPFEKCGPASRGGDPDEVLKARAFDGVAPSGVIPVVDHVRFHLRAVEARLR